MPADGQDATDAGHGGVVHPRQALLDALRMFAAVSAEVTRSFAAHLGLHATDAAGLAEILYAQDQGRPITPARLGERLGLTSGATTILVNRLERIGYVQRSREHADRRLVTLRYGPEVEGPARAFFAPYAETIDAMLARHDDETLDRVEAFMADLLAAHDEVLHPTPAAD